MAKGEQTIKWIVGARRWWQFPELEQVIVNLKLSKPKPTHDIWLELIAKWYSTFSSEWRSSRFHRGCLWTRHGIDWWRWDKRSVGRSIFRNILVIFKLYFDFTVIEKSINPVCQLVNSKASRKKHGFLINLSVSPHVILQIPKLNLRITSYGLTQFESYLNKFSLNKSVFLLSLFSLTLLKKNKTTKSNSPKYL